MKAEFSAGTQLLPVLLNLQAVLPGSEIRQRLLHLWILQLIMLMLRVNLKKRRNKLLQHLQSQPRKKE